MQVIVFYDKHQSDSGFIYMPEDFLAQTISQMFTRLILANLFISKLDHLSTLDLLT